MDPQLIGTIATGVIAVIVGVITTRAADRKDKKSDSQNLIDQLQEERSQLQKERQESVTASDNRVSSLERRHKVLEDYVGQLRRHIDDRLDPPAPPWPKELYNP